MKTTEAIRADFDRIARAATALRSDKLGPHEAALLDRLPGGARALDAGCGTGAVARRLATTYAQVDAVDLSPEMIRVARERSAAQTNIAFHLADLSDWLTGEPRYDCITSMAVMHHFDARVLVPRLVRALRPGGTLLIVDVTSRPGLRNLPLNGIAWLLQHLRSRSSAELRAAYRDHGRDESYLTPAEARALYAQLLPGAEVRAHLQWRYSVRWVTAPA